ALCSYAVALHGCRARRRLPSSPTRRSSDLGAGLRPSLEELPQASSSSSSSRAASSSWSASAPIWRALSRPRLARPVVITRAKARSEEHTSELQSRENLVCRLLLEKKNVRQS